MIKPTQEVPELKLPLINDTKWSLYDQDSKAFTMLVFYRGLHCPVCKNYLEALTKKLKDFSDRGVHLIAISSDSEERAKKAGNEWNIPELPVGYNLPIETARQWRYTSGHSSKCSTRIFSEALRLPCLYC